MMLRSAAVVLLVASVAAASTSACAGAPPSEARPPPKSPPPPPPLPPPPLPPPPLPPAARTAADHHREFKAGCAKKALNSPDYCECAWGEFRKVVTDEEMSAGEMPPPKLGRVKAQVLVACASLVPEDNVRADFGKACVGTKPELEPYCDCRWVELRKRFSTAELNDEATVSSERFLAAAAPVVKTCGNRMPEATSKEAFMRGCLKDPSVDKFCDCAWKELRKLASPAEIEAGTFDQKIVFAQQDKACGKLRPPRP